MKGAFFEESKFAGSNPEFNSLMLGAIGAKDPAASKAKLASAMAIMNQESGELIPGHSHRLYPAAPNLHGIDLTYITGYVINFRGAYLS